MNLLKRASSFLNSLRNSEESSAPKIGDILGKINKLKIVLIFIPIVIIGIMFLALITAFDYKLNMIQVVSPNGSNSSVECSGDGCVEIGDNGKGSLTKEQRQKIVQFAHSQIGVSYNYGPNGACGGGSWENDIPNQQLSCNGLTYHSYKSAGIEIPPGSREQMAQAPVVTSTGKVSDMTPGDIIVYDDVGRRSDVKFNLTSFRHVAIYIGDGQLIEGTCPVAVKRGISDYTYSYSVTW